VRAGLRGVSVLVASAAVALGCAALGGLPPVQAAAPSPAAASLDPARTSGLSTAPPEASAAVARPVLEVTLHVNGTEVTDSPELPLRRGAGLAAVAVVRNTGDLPVHSLVVTASGLGVSELLCDDDSVGSAAFTVCRAPLAEIAAGEHRQIVVEAVGIAPDGARVRAAGRGRVTTAFVDAYTGVVGLPLSTGVVLALVVLGGFLTHRRRTRRGRTVR
jgi:hypothetical protein